MRISLAQWVILDWQGPTSGVRFRIAANNNFTARDDDNTGVEIDTTPNSYREVDCTVGTSVIEGVTIKTITIPPFWLFSTNDAIAPIRTSTYRASFVTKSGREVQKLQLLQNFQLPKELEAVFNPVPWHEIIRVNYPAAPVPFDRETFSKEQILDLIGGGTILKGGNAAAPKFAFWSGPITVDGATGTEYQNADPMIRFVQQNASWNALRVVESAGAANTKVGGNPALFSTHVVNEAGLSQRAIINDAATRRWTEVVKDSGLGLQYSAYDNSNVLQSNTIFDPAGGIGFSDASAEFGYFYKASSAYHLGISAAVGASGASKEITFTTAGVGINKPTSIGAQLHAVSGATGRIGFQVDTAPSPSQPIAVFRNDTGVRFSFNHNAQATFGLASSVKGRLIFAAANNGNTQAIEAADTPGSAITYKLPATDPSAGQLLRTSSFGAGVAVLEWVNPTAGGDVSSSIGTTVDNRLARFDGTTGKLIQDSAVVVADTSGSFTVPDAWSITNAGGASYTLNATAQVFSAPTRSTTGQIYDFTAASQTQSSGLIEALRAAATYNQTSTAASNHLSLVRTETALGSGEHNFIKGFSGAAGTTARFRIDTLGNYYFGATGGIIGDQNGNEYIKFNTVTSAVNELQFSNASTGNAPKTETTGGDTNIPWEVACKGTGRFLVTGTGGVEIKSTQPILRWTDTDASKNWLIVTNGSGHLVIGEDAVSNAITIDHTTGLCTFEEIPVGPNATPTTDNQLARKKYVDDKAVFFTLTYKIDDPSTFATGTRAVLPVSRVPAIASGFMTRCHVVYSSGSHTSGGVLEFAVEVGFSEVGTVQLNNTNSTSGTFYTTDFTDSSISDGSALSAYLKTRTGTITERDVTLIFEGYQKVKSI